MTRQSFLSAVCVTVLSLSGLASVAEAQGGPVTTYLRARNDEVNTLLHEPASASRTTRVTAILSDLLDYDELAHRSLATHWDALTEAQRTDFVGLLRQLVEQQYQTNLEHLLDFDITYVSEAEVSGGRTVSTSARSRAERRQPPVEIIYTAHLVGTSWRVYDVTTDGVSMVRNYQQQFNRVITADGFDALLQRMRDRLAR